MLCLKKLDILLRSCIFSLIFVITLVFQAIACVLASPLPLKYRYKLITNYTSFIIWLLKIVCRVNYQIIGLENIPKDRNGIILSKHQSTWETFYLPTIFHEPAIILKKELLWVPFFGWGLATIEPIAINRQERAKAMTQIIAKGKKCLAKGRWILIFPEGTRIPYGQVGKYRLGGARVGIETGYPVIPVAHNAGRCWPKKGFIKTPGTITLVIGPLIETTGRTAEEVTTEAKNWIENTIEKLK